MLSTSVSEAIITSSHTHFTPFFFTLLMQFSCSISNTVEKEIVQLDETALLFRPSVHHNDRI